MQQRGGREQRGSLDFAKRSALRIISLALGKTMSWGMTMSR